MSSVFNIMSYHRFFDWGTSQSAHKLFILSNEGTVLDEKETPVDQLIRVYKAMLKNKGTKITAINFFLSTNFSKP